MECSMVHGSARIGSGFRRRSIDRSRRSSSLGWERPNCNRPPSRVVDRSRARGFGGGEVGRRKVKVRGWEERKGREVDGTGKGIVGKITWGGYGGWLAPRYPVLRRLTG